jgi:putative redox protein
MANTAQLTLETVEGDGLRFRAVAGSGQQTVVDSGPGMTAPSPIEQLLVSIAGCTAMDVISVLRKKRQRVTGYQVIARGERRDEHPRRYTSIEVEHRFTGYDLSPAAIERAIELSRTKYCSVSASIDPTIPITHRFEIVPEPSTPTGTKGNP